MPTFYNPNMRQCSYVNANNAYLTQIGCALDCAYNIPLLCIFTIVSNRKSRFYVVKFYLAPPKHYNILSSFCRWEEKKCKRMKKMMTESRWRSSDMLTQSLRMQTNTDTLKQITDVFLSRPIPSISIWFVSVSINESVWEWSIMLSNEYVCLYCSNSAHDWQQHVFTAVKTSVGESYFLKNNALQYCITSYKSN